MMEQDAKREGTQALDQEMMMDWIPKEEGDKPRNPSRNQEMMMEQDAKRIGRQAPEP